MLAMTDSAPHLVRRQDYAAPAFWIDSVDLTFDLDPGKTRVLNRMRVRRNSDLPAQALRLDGEDLNLARVMVNGQGTSFKLDGNQLVLANLPEGADAFDLEIFTTCAPAKNTKLMGLYISQDTFFTQCEAEGFRRITYFLDRPDVMASYSVTLRADKTTYPVLLSNGNLVEQGTLADGRHFAKWVDPHKKPSYLFALVAGNLVCRNQPIKSRSGTHHLLQIYVRAGDLDKTEHAMNSLMASIAWDETRFGLPLDLERFMIVATSDFNMGAMENKGLNIFNTKYVLASPATATDADFGNVEAVVAHEYFHNWTGNRVTCRDWFQLSLKEGLTVFRDQEFSQDMSGSPSARAVKRIEDVRVLRTAQFPEDAGPMAHPVRPDQYAEINNFYTVTIYEKGAEVVRMMQTLADISSPTAAKTAFARGMKLYFERHDGQAVTCDDFASAIADANPGSALAQHLPQFKRWYEQAGTPTITAQGQFDVAAGTYTLSFAQSASASADGSPKAPWVIPISMGLLSAATGAPLPMHIQGDDQPNATNATATRTLVLTQASQQIVLTGLTEAPIASLLRGFSAPVQLSINHSQQDLLTLLAHDTDPFNQWEAGQTLALQIVLAHVQASTAVEALELPQSFVEAMRSVLRHAHLDPAFKELVLTLPSEAYMAEQLAEVDPQRIHAVRTRMRLLLALALQADWVWAYQQHQRTGAYSPDAASCGHRALANLALLHLCLASTHTQDAVWPGKALQRFKDAGNMTDRLGALSALVQAGHPLADAALQRFHQLFQNDALVIDKWFAIQAGSPDRNGHALPLVRQLMRHPDFSLRNPNRARSVISTYCQANPAGFHRLDAAGYVFWSECVLELDAINPQVAARLARALDRWKQLAAPYRTAAREAIARVALKPDLSNDVREVIERALATA